MDLLIGGIDIIVSATYEFMDVPTANRLNTIGNIFQGLRDFLIDKYDLQTADNVLNQYSIDYLKEIEEALSFPSIERFSIAI